MDDSPKNAVAWIKSHMDDSQKNAALPPEASPEVGRALTRFALVGAAGALATEFGITGWNSDESQLVADRCFKDWVRARGGLGQSDDDEGIRQVRHFVQTHGTSRFQSIVPPRIDTEGNIIEEKVLEEKVLQRAGYWKTDKDGVRWYLIFPEVWEKDICAGYDPEQIAKALAADGRLLKGDGRNLTRKESVLGARQRFYVVSADL